MAVGKLLSMPVPTNLRLLEIAAKYPMAVIELCPASQILQSGSCEVAPQRSTLNPGHLS
jgi:hypothetical protein